ncbi:NupC family nucleoside transporter [Candidatus Magnetoovum chiemensis]|nr:NupC family nucleoside transporter [Candidatus Magnetoovum chiemensis]
MNIYNLISFSSIFVLIGFAWLFSTNRRNLNWRVIIWGILIQLVFALIVFVFPSGSKVFLFLNDLIVKIMDAASSGAKFIFGRLAVSPGSVSDSGEPSIGFILAFQAFPLLIFFSSLMSVLYFLTIMPRLIHLFARLFTKLMNISGAESLCNASNIFVGVESALTIKPYIREMTESELCSVLACGMATAASSTLAVYVITLKDVFPQIAGHLISASFLAIPAAIIMSKALLPESEIPKTFGMNVTVQYERENNIFEAIINGANDGFKLVVGICALLIAVLGLVSIVDMFLTAVGAKINTFAHVNIDWTLKGLLGYVFYPFTVLIGVPLDDADVISKIIGERAIVTEVISYNDLAAAIKNGDITNSRSIVITTYVLCGFAHLASMAIFVGGFAALCPEKTKLLSRVAFRALAAATLACLMTGSIAGTFYTSSAILAIQ